MAGDKYRSGVPGKGTPDRVRSGGLIFVHGKKADDDIRGEWSRLSDGGRFLAWFMDRGGFVNVGRVAETFRMSRSQLAATTGLTPATLSKSDRREGRKAQSRMTEMLEIISRIREWAGGEAQAMAWYRSQPLPALDGRTPEALVKDGRAAAVREYLDHLALGGFA
jgi:hypothetical protein